VTKLALYLDASPQTPRRPTRKRSTRSAPKTEEDGFMPLVNVGAFGRGQPAPGELRRMRESRSIRSACCWRSSAARRNSRSSPPGSGRAGDRRPARAEQKAHRVFWRDKRDLGVQLERWRGRHLERLVQRLRRAASGAARQQRGGRAAACAGTGADRAPGRCRVAADPQGLPIPAARPSGERCRKRVSTRCPTAAGSLFAVFAGRGRRWCSCPGTCPTWPAARRPR
jgi:hypothetical protein